MDLRQLRYFVTVAEELHFGHAAERLHMTQPPLSQAIQALEQEIGVKLFARTKRKVALTPVGAQWLTHVRRLLDDATGLPEIAVRLSRGETGSLSVAFVTTADYSVLPPLIRRYKEKFPEVQISLREATSDIQIDALLNGEIHAGLIVPPPRAALHPALAYRPLLFEPLVAVIPETWITTGRLSKTATSLDFSEVVDEPLIMTPRRTAPMYHDIVTGYYTLHGAKPHIGQEAIQMQTIISLVSAGLGIALVPQSLRNLGRTGIRYLSLMEKAPHIETGLVWRRDDDSPTVTHFIQMAIQYPPDPGNGKG